MSKCEICGKDGFHKLSCPNNKERQKQLLVDMMQADEKGGLYNKDIPMEIKHLSNDVYQVVQDGTVWFQGDLLNCHVYKNKHEDE